MGNDWPFGDDADRDDPLAKLRIPVVGSFNPGWRYIAAYLKPVTDGPDYLKGPPFGSNERPNEAEALMLASFIEEYKHYFFNEWFREKLMKRPLDVEERVVTTVFIKYARDDWGYRTVTWEYGYTFMPPPPAFREKHPEETGGGPLTLEQVMDRKHTIGDGPTQRWLDWKAAHPEAFGTG